MTTHIAYSWRCIAPIVPPDFTPCDAAGTGPKSYAEAGKHMDTTGHAVEVRGVPTK